MPKGKCLNYNNCIKADSEEIIETSISDPRCPICNEKLKIIDEPRKGISAIYIIVAVAILLVAIGGYLTYKTLSNIKEKRTEAKLDLPAKVTLNLPEKQEPISEQKVEPVPVQKPEIAKEQQQAPQPLPEHTIEIKKEILFSISTNNDHLATELLQKLIKNFIQKEFNINPDKINLVNSNSETTLVASKPEENIEYSAKIITDNQLTSLESFIEKKIDLLITNNRLKNIHSQKIQNPDSLKHIDEKIICLDAIVLVTNKNNPIKKLSLDDIKGIYSGQVTNWSNVGGLNVEIKPISLDENSYTFNLLTNIIKLDKPSSNVDIVTNNQELLKKISENTNAIGFLRLNELNDKDKYNLIEVYNGKSISLKPTTLNIKTEDYLLTKRIYLYSISDSSNQYLSKFLNYVQTNETQELIDTLGFLGQTAIPLKIEFNNLPLDKRSPNSRYHEIIKNASQVPFNVRFNDQGEIDTKARNDLLRLKDTLSKPELSNKKIVLIGFSDDVGSSHQNIVKAHEKAQLVKDFLTKENIKVSEVYSLGEEFPVDSYSTIENRNRNIRVEIWIRD